ncbi:hypothetical protein C8R46DRAFT_938626 [Mycena filopes]|nr:hypothetical protein C8R46DRAFT_938626 [Mycena filopes]
MQSASTESEQKKFDRVQELWFEDGNIILQAGNTQYRVFRGILAARSPVFQDMLSFPQPPASELVEGCPLVHLHDSATEVTVFLRALFDSGYFLPYPFATDLNILSGTLRLSHKYGVEFLRRRALIHLSSSYPTTFSDFEAIFIHPNEDLPLFKCPSWIRPESLPYKIFIVHLAREVEALWILPLAFYSLGISFTSLGPAIFHGTNYNGVSATLSLEDQKSFVAGHNAQSMAVTDDILRFLIQPFEIDGCEGQGCYQRRLAALEASRAFRQIDPCHPLAIWDHEGWELLNEICSVCIDSLDGTHAEAQQKFWDGLPGIYGLPSWKELEAMRAAAVGEDLEILA